MSRAMLALERLAAFVMFAALVFALILATGCEKGRHESRTASGRPLIASCTWGESDRNWNRVGVCIAEGREYRCVYDYASNHEECAVVAKTPAEATP